MNGPIDDNSPQLDGSVDVGGLREKKTQSKWLSFAAIACGVFLATVDGSIVNVAMPTMVESLQSSFASVQWVVLAYLLVVALLLPLVGRVADMFGKKHIYSLGFLIFTFASLLCGLAPGVGWLIAARVLQAVGAAMVMALGPALVAESFPASERGKAMGLIGTVVSVGVIAGPTLGGLLIEHLTWHWIFYVNLPVGLLGAWLGWRFIPSIKLRAQTGFDFPGAAALLVFLLSLLLSLTMGQELGFLHPIPVGLFLVAIAGFAVFLAIERRARFPVIDLRLFRHREFAAGLGVGTLLFISMSGVMFLMPFYLQHVLGLTVLHSGLALAVHPVALGIVAPFAGSAADRYGSRIISLLGLAFVVLGVIGLATLEQDTTVLGYVWRILPIGIGFGLFQSPNNTAILSSAPREHWGVASSLLSISRVFGQVAGISIMGTVWAVRTQMHAGVELPLGAAGAAPAQQMAGFHDTVIVVTGLVILAFLIQWRLGKQKATATAPPKEKCKRAQEDGVVEAAALSASGD